MSTGVALVGAAECDLGRTGRTVLELQVQAVTRVLADAGLTLADVDGLATNDIGRFSTTELADQLRIQPAWVDSSFVGGSAFEAYVARAAQAIAAGQASVVVVSFASNQRSARSRSLGGVLEDHLPAAQFETPYAPLYPLSYYAMAAQAYLHRYGLTREHLAHVAVSARDWALLNPVAFQHDAGPLTVAEVLGSDMVSSPLTKADCCLVTDGGGAVVVTSLERARDLPKAPAVLLGYGEATGHAAMATPDDVLDIGAAAAGRAAFARAGLRPADVDVAEVYDSFTITPLLSLEALGLADRARPECLPLLESSAPAGPGP